MLSVFGLTGRGRKPYVIDVLRDGVMFKRVRKGCGGVRGEGGFMFLWLGEGLRCCVCFFTFNGDGLLWSFVDVMVLCMVLCMCTC